VTPGKNPTFTAVASDNLGVSKVEFYLDAASTPVVTDATSPYTATINTKSAASGAHTVKAKAYDAGGNSASASMVFTKK